MPHGIVPPFCNFRSPSMTESCAGENSDIAEKKPEHFFSLRQRFTYFQQPNNESTNILQLGSGNSIHVVPKRKRAINKESKPARVMRLRPRQVLCSKCKSICNENSENVESIARTANGQSNQPISRSDFGVNTSPRLTLAERINSNIKQPKGDPEINIIKNSPLHHSLATSPRTFERCDSTGPRLVEKMILRKRKADQAIDNKGGCQNPMVAEEWTKKIPNCDSPNQIPFSEQMSKAIFPTENALPAPKLMVSRNEVNDTFEAKMINKCQQEPKTLEKTKVDFTEEMSEHKYPVIKISFTNPKGEGTVMKIPRRTGKVVPPSPIHSDDQGIFRLSNRPNFSPNPHKDGASAKAAKKALKKAKKEAQRKARIAYGGSTPHSSDPIVLRTPNRSPHHRVRSKHHHKHKLKHKRKHRDDEKRIHLENDLQADDSDEAFEEAKEEDTFKLDTSIQQKECLKQKLSISLKRLNKGSYCAAPREEDLQQDFDPNSDVFISESKPRSFPSESSSNNSDNSTDCPPEAISDSEQLNKVKPLMMRITTHNVNKTCLSDGRIMYVGDIVWGKIQGFPWWPGKVLAITVSQRDNGAQITQQAHVTWYGSSTSSYMLCHRLLPFLEEFEHRYNKKKRGPYREAIRQATEEAKHLELERLNLELVSNKQPEDTPL